MILLMMKGMARSMIMLGAWVVSLARQTYETWMRVEGKLRQELGVGGAVRDTYVVSYLST